MPSTVSECDVEDEIDKKNKRKKLQTNASHGDEAQSETETRKKKKRKLKSKEKTRLASSIADDQIEEPNSQNQTFHSDESNQLCPLPVDDQPVAHVKKIKKRKKITSAEIKSSISQDVEVDDRESALGSPVVLENKEKKRKNKKKCIEWDAIEEKNHNGDEECLNNGTKTKKKKKATNNEEEHLETVQSNHSNVPYEICEREGDSLSTHATAIISDDTEEVETKKKKKHKLKHKERRKLSSSDHIASEKHENNVVEENDECDTTMHKTKTKKKKRKRGKEESDNVCNFEEGQEENVKVKSSKKKKKMKNDHGNSVDEDDSHLPHSHTTPKSKLFMDAVFESAERENQFSRVTGKPAKVKDDEKNQMVSSSEATIEEISTPPFVRGQWQGALFENIERQSKFLRLLGGMKSAKEDKKCLFSSQNSSSKKGLYGSLAASMPNLNSPSDNSTKAKGGKALCISDAAQRDKRLEEDYNKAMNLKLSGTKGAGLGFAQDPAEGKKFHIDANSTKSLKFDNDDD